MNYLGLLATIFLSVLAAIPAASAEEDIFATGCPWHPGFDYSYVNNGTSGRNSIQLLYDFRAVQIPNTPPSGQSRLTLMFDNTVSMPTMTSVTGTSPSNRNATIILPAFGMEAFMQQLGSGAYLAIIVNYTPDTAGKQFTLTQFHAYPVGTGCVVN